MIKKIKYLIEAILFTFFGIAKLIGLTLSREFFALYLK